MTTDHTCPRCDGRKESWAFVDGVRDGKRFGERRKLPCSTCGGVGTISDEHLERLKKGETMREDRKARGLSLRDEAKRLGISHVKLSDMEHRKKEQTEGK